MEPRLPSLPPRPWPRRGSWLLAAAVALGLLAWSARGVDLAAIGRQVLGARPGWLGFGLSAYLASIMLWTRMWQEWVRPAREIPWRRMARVTTLLLLGANTLPVFGGHAVGVALLLQQERLPLSAALSVLAVDQVFEGLAKAACLLLAAIVAPVSLWLAGALGAVAAGALALLALLLAAAWHLPVARWLPRGEAGIKGRIARFAREWAEHLQILREARRFSRGLAMALLCKTGEIAAIFYVQQSLGVELPWAATLLVLCAVQVAGMIPFSPGNLGVYEAAVSLTYTGLGLPPALSLSLALLQHVTYLVAAILPGLTVLLWRAIKGPGELAREAAA